MRTDTERSSAWLPLPWRFSMGRSRRSVCASIVLLIVVAACRDQDSTPTEPQPAGTPSFRTASGGAPEVLQNAIIHRTVEAVAAANRAGPPGASTVSNLSYRGGVGGV